MNDSITVVKSLLTYKKQSWMVGGEEIDRMQEQLSRLQRVAAAIQHFERQAAIAFEDSQEPSKLGFDHFNKKYESKKGAANWLRKRFNIEANEIQL